MESTLNQEILMDTSSVLLGNLGINEKINLTPVDIAEFERLDKWGHIIFYLDDPLKQSQPEFRGGRFAHNKQPL